MHSWLFLMGIPSSANMGNPSCEHPSTLPAQAHPVGQAARPPRPLQVSWRKWGLDKFPSVTVSKHPGGKALTPSLVRSHILQKPGNATAKNLCGWTDQPTAHRLQAMPAADGSVPGLQYALGSVPDCGITLSMESVSSTIQGPRAARTKLLPTAAQAGLMEPHSLKQSRISCVSRPGSSPSTQAPDCQSKSLLHSTKISGDCPSWKTQQLIMVRKLWKPITLDNHQNCPKAGQTHCWILFMPWLPAALHPPWLPQTCRVCRASLDPTEADAEQRQSGD